VSTSTPQAIRDRIRAVVASIDPVSLIGDRFIDSRNEFSGDFREWAETNPAAAFRRYQVRADGHDEPPTVSNTVIEERRVVFEILIAYPQNHRYGDDGAMDRDDVIDEDWDYLDFNLGICGKVNFTSTDTGSYDCTPLGCTKEIERGDVCDFLVIRAEYQYQRALAVGGLAQGVGG
jgi:hypothetical protein